jgi:hypothetical protein
MERRNKSLIGFPEPSKQNIYFTVQHFLWDNVGNCNYLKKYFFCIHHLSKAVTSCTNSNSNFKKLVMKTIIALAMIIIAVLGCRAGRDIQVEFVMAKLIKIDTVQRFTTYEKILTWEDTDRIRYTSRLPMERTVAVGMQMVVMRRR